MHSCIMQAVIVKKKNIVMFSLDNSTWKHGTIDVFSEHL